MAKITKSLPTREPAYTVIKDLLASNIIINGTDETVFDHIQDNITHLTQAEKAMIEDIVLNGAGVSDEDMQKIIDLINTKQDKNDTSFYIAANQVIETVDRKFVNGTEKNALSGVTDNIQLKLNEYGRKAKETLSYKGVYTSYANMSAAITSPEKGNMVFITTDETDFSAKTIYIHNGTGWERVRSDKGGGAGWIASAIEPSKDILWLDINNPSNIVIKWHNGLTWKIVGGSVTLPISANDVTEANNKSFLTDAGKALLANLKEDSVSGGLVYKGVLIGSTTGAVIDDTLAALDKTYSSSKVTALLANKQDKLLYTPENITNKNVANGYAGLDNVGLVHLNRLPNVAKHQTHVVNNKTDRLAINSTTLLGDYAYELTTGQLFMRVDSTDKWVYVADSYKIKQTAINKLDGTYNPTENDDNAIGYSVGSIWINTITKKSYICTDATSGAAQWDLMGGQINMNASQIIPFLFDETLAGRVAGQTRFLLPSFDEFESYIEVSRNGLELIRDKDYTIANISGVFYLDMSTPTEVTDIINGEIYQADVDNVEEYMVKNVYDSNYDGKVDRAEIADYVAGLPKWESGKGYKTNNLILKDNQILRSTRDFMSGLTFDPADWKPVKAMPINLTEFTTADLVDSLDKRYVTDTEKTNINQIPNIQNSIISLGNTDASLQSQINTIKSYIPGSTSPTNKLIDDGILSSKLQSYKLRDLFDVQDIYTPKAFLRINSTGSGVEYALDPRFPIMQVTDMVGSTYKDIYDLELSYFQKKSFSSGKLILEPKMRTTNLLDMPAINTHGALLISNKTLMQYDLVPADQLSISQENLKATVQTSDWVLNGSVYQYTLTHNLDSEALIISFTNATKEEISFVTYKIIDSKTVLFISTKDEPVNITINCSLGVLNGYWNHMFDISKITLIDDKEAKLDRTYSSMKLEATMKNFAIRDYVYSKTEANNVFATKTNEHTHNNYSTINKISEDTFGNIMFNDKKLLTDIAGRTISISKILNTGTLTEIINTSKAIIDNSVNTILSSEIVIKNTSSVDIDLLIKDGNLILIDEKIASQEVEKYILGVSTGTTISVNGKCEYNYYMSAI